MENESSSSPPKQYVRASGTFSRSRLTGYQIPQRADAFSDHCHPRLWTRKNLAPTMYNFRTCRIRYRPSFPLSSSIHLLTPQLHNSTTPDPRWATLPPPQLHHPCLPPQIYRELFGIMGREVTSRGHTRSLWLRCGVAVWSKPRSR